MTFVRSSLHAPVIYSLIGHPYQGPLWQLVRECDWVGVTAASCERLAAGPKFVVKTPLTDWSVYVAAGPCYVEVGPLMSCQHLLWYNAYGGGLLRNWLTLC